MIDFFPSLLGRIALLGAALSVAACAPERLPGEVSFREVRVASGESEDYADQIDLVRLDGRTLSLGEFDRQVRALPPVARRLFDTAERRISLLEFLVQLQVLARDAERRGLVEGPIERLFVEEQRALLFLEDRRRNAEVPLALDSIADEELAQAWQAEVVPWLAEASRDVHVIVAPDRETAERWRDELTELRTTSRETPVEAFRWMARTRSVDAETAADGGRIGWLRPARPDQQTSNYLPLVEAAFALGNAGDVSEAVETARGWELVTFTAVRRGFDVTEESYEAVLREQLLARRLAERDVEELRRLRSGAEISLDVAAIERAESARIDPPRSPVARRWEADGIARTPAAFLSARELRDGSVERRDEALHHPRAAASLLTPNHHAEPASENP